MQIQLETGGRHYLIRSYGPGQITVGETAYRSSLIVLPDRLFTDWPPQSVMALSVSHMQDLAALDCEVLLLGTGQLLRFPPAAILAPLTNAGIGIEVMDTGAACRTYNILMGEGRRVAAALMPIVKEPLG
jgi:uncharacterized protein